ncbi:hypothetical protein CR513_27366, partial [Mucuna pruriens]
MDNMADNNRTLKELTILDVVYQPWCIRYPKFHGLEGEDPYMHLKVFHIVCSTMRLHGIPENCIKIKTGFPKEMPQGLPPLRGIEHHIDIIKQVETLLEKGWVRKSKSPYVGSVILVPEKDDTWKMCMDCRPINVITVRYRHLMPCLDDLLNELLGAIIFLRINSRTDYHQIKVREGDG